MLSLDGGGLFPNKLRRARTPKGEPTLEFERPEPPAIRPATVSGFKSAVGKIMPFSRLGMDWTQGTLDIF